MPLKRFIAYHNFKMFRIYKTFPCSFNHRVDCLVKSYRIQFKVPVDTIMSIKFTDYRNLELKTLKLFKLPISLRDNVRLNLLVTRSICGGTPHLECRMRPYLVISKEKQSPKSCVTLG